jgi:hypothetical protein
MCWAAESASHIHLQRVDGHRPEVGRRLRGLPTTSPTRPTEELRRLLGLADSVHLDDDHAFAADVGQVDGH